jgi:hypothetical protein
MTTKLKIDDTAKKLQGLAMLLAPTLSLKGRYPVTRMMRNFMLKRLRGGDRTISVFETHLDNCINQYEHGAFFDQDFCTQFWEGYKKYYAKVQLISIAETGMELY